MADFLGNGLGNTITGTAGNDLISGRGGNDTLDGGGLGNIVDFGYDRIFGGTGNDFILARGVLRGGSGNDEVGGAGILYGDGGRDIVELFSSGSAFGNDGNDRMIAALDFPGDARERDLTGNAGADTFTVRLSPLDAIAVRVEVKDFQRLQGDKLVLYQTDPNGNALASVAQTFDHLDSNHDRVLSAADGGPVHTDPDGLALQGADGDVMVLVGRISVSASDFLLG